MPSLTDVYGATLKVYPVRSTRGMLTHICAELDGKRYLFAPFLDNGSYGICSVVDHRIWNSASIEYTGEASGVLWNGQLTKQIYRYEDLQVLSEIERRCRQQSVPFPLPHAQLYVYYGEGYLAYANEAMGYIMMNFDVLHIFTKKQGNYPERIYPLKLQDRYHMDRDGRLVILMKDALQRIRDLDAGVFADPFVWLEQEDKVRRTMVYQGTPMLPTEEPNE